MYPASSGTLTNFQGTVSLNAAIFASVLLASRLETALHVFGFIFFSFCIFAGLPFLAYHARWYSTRTHVVLTLLFFLGSLRALHGISRLCALVYLISVLFVSLVCPFGLQWVQRYKNHLEGPWDYDTESELQQDNL
jgi:phosphatidylinositol glycan class C protein